jgi:hypothetical protein
MWTQQTIKGINRATFALESTCSGSQAANQEAQAGWEAEV